MVFVVLMTCAPAAIVLPAFSGSSVAQSSRRGAQAAATGTATFALQPTDAFSWIFPLENSANEEPWTLGIDENLWLPLYFEGKGSSPVIDYSRSLADAPVYSDGGKDGHDHAQALHVVERPPSDTTCDIEFFFNIYKVGEPKIGTYVEGEFPGNITSIDYVSATTFVLHLDRVYSEEWYTDNQLVNIVPLPQQAWDRGTAGGPVGNYDRTTAGATKVFNFLYGQSETLSTYASNLLWQVVDGPFTITSYDSVNSRTELTVNKAYRGPDQARLAHVIVEGFPSNAAEVDALRSGEVDYGYIPYSDCWACGVSSCTMASPLHRGRLTTRKSVEVGYTSPVYGPLVGQLYIRQALQHLVNEQLYLKTTLDGVGQLTYGPVPNIPNSPYVSPAEKHDPYPYSTSAAKALLIAHGWKLGSNGIMVCKRAGTAANECGAKIAVGRSLTLLMNFTITDLVELASQAEAFQTAARSAGIEIDLAPLSGTTMYSQDGVCPPGPCNYALALYPLWFTNYGDLQISADARPAISARATTGAGGTTRRLSEQLIGAAQDHTGLSYLYAVGELHRGTNEAAIWWPTGDNQISVVSDSLHGTLAAAAAIR